MSSLSSVNALLTQYFLFSCEFAVLLLFEVCQVEKE